MRFSEPSGFRRLQNGDPQAQALESACRDPDARPHARFRRANARSRREAGEFFSRSETVDAPGTKRIVEFSTWLFRSSSALR